MGSGKTAVGQQLAEVLGVPFLDLDTQIEEATQLSVSEIFEKKGEIFFRRKEFETLQNLLTADSSFVLATGGGTPCYGTSMQQIKEAANTKSVFLHASLDVLTKRLFLEKSKRPLIAHLETEALLYDFIRKHIFERNFYYQQAAIKVDANNEVAAVVAAIVIQLF